ncbi:MAG: 6-phosphogluconolactonase, partial [Chlamydiae bacterium]|nr:6-phosphogluconolactonase [Chlamydiota bacterium]
MKTVDLDERRRLLLPGSHEETIQFAVQEWIALANRAISDHGFFTVALSGGSTPKAIFKLLSTEYQDAVDWNKVFLFWSDERAVPPQSPESNYHMAMKEAGLENLHIHDRHIFRMQAEKDLERYSDRYAEHVHRNVKREQFDLIMLGMGDDG